MPQGKWFRIGYGIIVILLIAYLASLVDFIFNPIGDAVAALFVPIVVSGILYYLFRPLVERLSRRLPLTLSILLVFVAVIGLLVAASLLVWPPIRQQAFMLVDNFPEILKKIQAWLLTLQDQQWLRDIGRDENFKSENLTSQLTGVLGDLLNSVAGSVKNLFDIAMNFFLLLGLVPFIVYYMLKEGHKFPQRVVKLLPDRIHNEALLTLKEIDESIGSFTMSKIITSLVMGGLVFCGYLIIDLPYSMLLALVAAVTNVIPYLGPLLAGIPAVVVALTVSPAAVLEVVVIIVIANQIESNLVSPKIMGKQLNVHPLTIMLLVIGASAIIGPLGMVVVVPTYAIVKIIAVRAYQFHQNNRIRKDPTLLPPRN